jgi:hypothetical protein
MSVVAYSKTIRFVTFVKGLNVSASFIEKLNEKHPVFQQGFFVIVPASRYCEVSALFHVDREDPKDVEDDGLYGIVQRVSQKNVNFSFLLKEKFLSYVSERYRMDYEEFLGGEGNTPVIDLNETRQGLSFYEGVSNYNCPDRVYRADFGS